MEYVQFILNTNSSGQNTTQSFPLEAISEIYSTEDAVVLFFDSVSATLAGEINSRKYYYGTRITLFKTGNGNNILGGLLNALSKAYWSDAVFPTIINLTQLTNTITVEDIVGSSYPAGGTGAFMPCGSFYDTTSQLSGGITAANIITFNTTTITNGVYVTGGSRMTVQYPGIYNIQFSAQIDKTDSGIDFVDLWLSKNGANLPDSNTSLYLPGNNAKVVAAWNFVIAASGGDYFELVWSSTDEDVLLYYQGPTSGPLRPAIPSVIASVTWAGATA
jgi:hypothetical protein